jgi:hypothetical protein
MTESDHTELLAQLGNDCDAPAGAVTAIERHGLQSLLLGEPATVTGIADRSGLPVDEIAVGVDGLIRAGRIEIDDDRITGVGGLTLTSTPHTLELPDASMHTWCALDAIGIPVALGLVAEITTICPHCGTELVVSVSNGTAHAPNDVVLFCPTGPCSHVRADFCAAANLFCDSDHLASWKATNADTAGDELDLEQTAELGRAIWGSHVSSPQSEE